MTLEFSQGWNSDIAKANLLDSCTQNFRPMLMALENKGLVTRGHDPNDGRARCIEMTKKGRRVFEQLRRDSQPFRDQLMAALDGEDVQDFVDKLRQVQAVMESDVTSSVGER